MSIETPGCCAFLGSTGVGERADVVPKMLFLGSCGLGQPTSYTITSILKYF